MFDNLFQHPIATITVDGTAVKKSALRSLSNTHPHIIGLICCVHSLNLLMKHLVNKVPWMSHTLDESKKIIKFFKNRQRPREILKIEYPKQLSLPPETRFCYSLLALKGLSEASNALKSLARATITENAALSSMKKEWVRLHQDYQSNDKKKLVVIQDILRD